MIPIKLSLEGLYSYQKKQEIDFTRLVEAGVFGVFGKVGSGKSSILEAISFGLYGESERLNARDNRAYNMMNLKSDVAIIDFEFYNFEDRKYRIRREFRRNSKRFDDVKRVDAVLYEWINEEWIPLPELDMEKVVGLSYENFKRTIIIPQGQFKEFIELGGAARTKMMQQIFNLDRFDLAPKVKVLHLKTKEKFDQVVGRLQGLAEVKPEVIEQKESLFKIESEKLHSQKELLKSETIILQQMSLIKQDFKDLTVKQADLVKYKEMLPEMNVLKHRLDEFELVNKVFTPFIKEMANSDSRRIGKERHLKTLKKDEVKVNMEFSGVKEELSLVELQYKDLDGLKIECNDLKLISEINKLQIEKEALALRFANGNKFVKESEEVFLELQAKLKDKSHVLVAEKEKRVDTQMLLLIDDWFKTKHFIFLSVEEITANVANLLKEKEELEASIENLKFKDIAKWEDEIEHYRSSFLKEQNRLEEEFGNIRLREQLSDYAEQLCEGIACPLCGSLDHPSVLERDRFFEEKNLIVSSLDEIKDKMVRLNTYQSTAKVLFEKKLFLEKQYSELLRRLNEIEKQQAALEELFVWKSLNINSLEEFNSWKQEATQRLHFIEQLDREYSELLVKSEETRAKLQDAKQELGLIELNLAKVDSVISSISAQVTRLNIEAYLRLNNELVLQELDQKLKHINWVETRQGFLLKQCQELQPKLIALQTEISTTLKGIEEITLEETALQEELKGLLLSTKMESMNKVILILEQPLDTEVVRSQLNDFNVKLEVITTQVNVLQEKLKGLVYKEEDFLGQQKKVVALEEEVRVLTEASVRLKGEVNRLTKELEVKRELEETCQKIDVRLKNISVLENMFKGSGFVNYVSSIYLNNLCDMANNRFHRLTNNQLSLQLNEQNDFEIIDYLNDGHARSVKTLSGGQTFQVALSLALALAESVQSLSKSNKNFFFIDEGFGTQDSESVNIVFETLSNLRKENRIVGIISHVDELQERIPVSLTVTKDDSLGSIIAEYNV